MKYILMMNCPRTGYDWFASLPKKDIQAHIAFMHSFNKALRESGELVAAEGLADPKEAKRRASRKGRRADHGRRVPGSQRVSRRLLDHRGRESRASLCDRRAGVNGAGTRRGSVEHADRGTSGDERRAPRWRDDWL